MKKILSIAAASALASIFTVMGAQAANNAYTQEQIPYNTDILKNCCDFQSLTESAEIPSNIENLLEMLKNRCSVKIKCNCYNGEKEDINDKNDKNEENIPPEQDFSDTLTPDNSNTSNEENIFGNSNENSTENTLMSAFAQEVVNLVNDERSKYGLSALSSQNALLNSAAYTRAWEQAEVFSHTRPNGTSWTTVLKDNGINYSNAGENVAYGQPTPKDVMEAWMNSSGHRENILNPNYSKIGVGVYSNNNTLYWAQIFIN